MIVLESDKYGPARTAYEESNYYYSYGSYSVTQRGTWFKPTRTEYYLGNTDWPMVYGITTSGTLTLTGWEQTEGYTSANSAYTSASSSFEYAQGGWDNGEGGQVGGGSASGSGEVIVEIADGVQNYKSTFERRGGTGTNTWEETRSFTNEETLGGGELQWNYTTKAEYTFTAEGFSYNDEGWDEYYTHTVNVYALSQVALTSTATIQQLSTMPVGQSGFTTILTQKAGSVLTTIASQVATSRMVVDTDAISSANGEWGKSVASKIQTAFADEGERLVYFNGPDMPYSAGQIIDAERHVFTVNVSSRNTTFVVYEDDTRRGGYQTAGYTVATSALPFSVGGVPAVIIIGASLTTSIVTQLVDVPVTTNTLDTIITSGNSTEGRTDTLIRLIQGGRASTREGGKSSTLPIFGEAALFATTNSGWVVASQGFHKNAPSSTLASELTFLFTVGSARPDVKLYPPIASPTPIYLADQDNYFAGEGLGLIKSYAKKRDSAIATVAFTQTQGLSSTSISPNVVKITRPSQTNVETSTITPQGSAASTSKKGWVEKGLSFIGGENSELSVIWTLVVGGKGCLYSFNRTNSGSTHFYSPATSTYSGTDVSAFQFVSDYRYGPWMQQRYYSRDAYSGFGTNVWPGETHIQSPVIAIPLYNYEEI